MPTRHPLPRPLDPLLRLGGGLFQAIRSTLIGVPSATMDYGYQCGGAVLGAMAQLGSGSWKQAGRSLGGAVGKAAEATIALPLVGSAHLLIDGFAGVMGGALFGSPLTDEEQRFARSIFGDALPLDAIRLVETGWHGRGMASSSTIYLDRRDLADPVVRATFAHELTHIYQDARWLGCHRGTLRATWQAILHSLKLQNVYQLDLDRMTDWNALEPESQAVVVQCWVEAKAYAKLPPGETRDGLEFYLNWRHVDIHNPDHLGRLEKLLIQAHLFRGIEGTATPGNWEW